MSATPPSILGAEESAAIAAFRQYINNPSIVETIQEIPKLYDAYLQVFRSIIAQAPPRFTDNILRQLNGCTVILGSISDIRQVEGRNLTNIVLSKNATGTFLDNIFGENDTDASTIALKNDVGTILNNINNLTNDGAFADKYLTNLNGTLPTFIPSSISHRKSIINKKFLTASKNVRVFIITYLLLYVNYLINGALYQIQEVIRKYPPPPPIPNSDNGYSGNEAETVVATSSTRPVRRAPTAPLHLELPAEVPTEEVPINIPEELLDADAVRPTDPDLANLIDRKMGDIFEREQPTDPHVLALKRAVILNYILTYIYNQKTTGAERNQYNNNAAQNIGRNSDAEVQFAVNNIKGYLGPNAKVDSILTSTDYNPDTVKYLITSFLAAYDSKLESTPNRATQINITLDILRSLHILKAAMKKEAAHLMDENNAKYGVSGELNESDLEFGAPSVAAPPPGTGTGLGSLPPVLPYRHVEQGLLSPGNLGTYENLLGANSTAPLRRPVSLADSGMGSFLPTVPGLPQVSAEPMPDVGHTLVPEEHQITRNGSTGPRRKLFATTPTTAPTQLSSVPPPPLPGATPVTEPPIPTPQDSNENNEDSNEPPFSTPPSERPLPNLPLGRIPTSAKEPYIPPFPGIEEGNENREQNYFTSMSSNAGVPPSVPVLPPPRPVTGEEESAFSFQGSQQQDTRLTNTNLETNTVEEPLITSLVAALAHMANRDRNIPSEPRVPEISAPEEPVAPVGEALNISDLIAVLAHMAQTPARPSLTTAATNALIEPASVPAPSTLQSILVEPSAQCDTLPSSTITVPTFPQAPTAAAAAPEVVPSTNISPLVAVLSSMAPPSVPGAPTPIVPTPTSAASLPAPSDASSLVAALAGMTRPGVPGAPTPTPVAPAVEAPAAAQGPSVMRRLGTLFKRTGPQYESLGTERATAPPGEVLVEPSAGCDTLPSSTITPGAAPGAAAAAEPGVPTAAPTSRMDSLVASLAALRRRTGEGAEATRRPAQVPIRGVARTVGPVGRRPAAPRQQLVQGLPSLFPSRRQIMAPAAAATPTPEAAVVSPELGRPLVGTPAMGDAFMRTEEAAIANMVAEFAALRKSGSNELERQIAAVKAELKDADALPKDQRETDVVRTRREELKALIKQFDEQLKKLQREMAEISAKGMIAILEKKRNDLQAELDLLAGGEYLDIFGDLYHTRIIHPTNTEYAIPSLGSVNQLFINYRMGLYKPEKIKGILEILSKYFSRNSPQFMMLPTECPPEDLRVIIPLLRQRLETLDTQIRKATFAATPMTGAVVTPLAHYYREIYDKITEFLQNLESVCRNIIPRVMTRREAVEEFLREIFARSLFAVTEAFLQTIFEKMAEGTVRGELAATKGQLEVAQRELTEAKARADELAAKSDEYVSKVKELTSAADKSAEETARLVKEAKQLAKEKADLAARLENVTNAISRARAAAEAEGNSAVNDTASIETVQDISDRLQEIIDELQLTIRDLKKRIDVLKDASAGKDERIGELTELLATAEQELEQLRAQEDGVVALITVKPRGRGIGLTGVPSVLSLADSGLPPLIPTHDGTTSGVVSRPDELARLRNSLSLNRNPPASLLPLVQTPVSPPPSPPASPITSVPGSPPQGEIVGNESLYNN